MLRRLAAETMVRHAIRSGGAVRAGGRDPAVADGRPASAAPTAEGNAGQGDAAAYDADQGGTGRRGADQALSGQGQPDRSGAGPRSRTGAADAFVQWPWTYVGSVCFDVARIGVRR